MIRAMRITLAVLVVSLSGCVIEVSDEETELAVSSEELFVSISTISLAVGKAIVVNDSAAASPAPWSVASIATPGGVPVRKNRWSFQNFRVVGAALYADLVVGPAIPGNPLDANLAALAASNAQICIRVAFGNGTTNDLFVNLTP